MNKIAEPLTLPCGVTLPNRLFKSAMTEGMADEHDRATPRHAALYRRWAEGGTGTLVTGNVMVDRRFLERPGNVVIDNNGGEEALRAWAEAGTCAGNQLWMQINHPGRQCQKLVSSAPLSPSEVALDLPPLFAKPKAMNAEDIEAALADFARVAMVAKDCGFTGVQVHAAHGYLISQFLSPIANRREDQWGGSLENRAQFLLEAVRRVREAVGPNFPVSVKMNSADFSKGGFSLDDSVQVAQWLEQAGIDLLEISGGTYEKLALMGETIDASTAQTNTPAMPASSAAREAYFLDYAKRIRAAVSIPLAVTGGFRSRDAMEQALSDGALDVIGLGRPLCTEPDVQELLNGQAGDGGMQGFQAWEQKLRIGPGWLGPRSGNATMRTLNFSAATQWYYQQILNLADGQPLLRHTGIIWRTIKHSLREIGIAKRRQFRGR